MATAVASAMVAFYVDTCAFLDIVRLPMRSRAPIRELAAIRTILDGVKAGRASLHISDIVPEEFERHLEGVLQEVQRHVRRLRDESAVVHDCADHLSLGEIDWSVDPVGLTEMLSAQAREALDAAEVLVTSTQDRLDAMDRQVKSLRPGRRGKDCLSDCMITTSMVRAAAARRVRSIFLSSNVRDYSEDEKTPRIHGDLKQIFEDLNITFVITWEWAASLVAEPSQPSRDARGPAPAAPLGER